MKEGKSVDEVLAEFLRLYPKDGIVQLPPNAIHFRNSKGLRSLLTQRSLKLADGPRDDNISKVFIFNRSQFVKRGTTTESTISNSSHTDSNTNSKSSSSKKRRATSNKSDKASSSKKKKVAKEEEDEEEIVYSEEEDFPQIDFSDEEEEFTTTKLHNTRSRAKLKPTDESKPIPVSTEKKPTKQLKIAPTKQEITKPTKKTSVAKGNKTLDSFFKKPATDKQESSTIINKVIEEIDTEELILTDSEESNDSTPHNAKSSLSKQPSTAHQFKPPAKPTNPLPSSPQKFIVPPRNSSNPSPKKIDSKLSTAELLSQFTFNKEVSQSPFSPTKNMTNKRTSTQK